MPETTTATEPCPASLTVAGKTFRIAAVGTESVPDSDETTIAWLVTKPSGDTYGIFAKDFVAASAMVEAAYG